MYKMKRENNILICNIECSIYEAPFEFIEDKNDEAIVNGINMVRNKDESINIEFHAKCNVCGYRAKYNGILEL